ncbi:hypothetical protein A1Q2_04174 [Trichosporon asahii var. asahii CBS 8904]|uniref:Uncharacterized protein n=1 Tax=Trichosporon asahii var. asahii (strain CBS 8904) TaxID=1220162 RepID=K1VY29_TRIAC|nr:hypothetical protein A1Q2_04174 [Trichosporon asahii var. asahii CBS 8904]
MDLQRARSRQYQRPPDVGAGSPLLSHTLRPSHAHLVQRADSRQRGLLDLLACGRLVSCYDSQYPAFMAAEDPGSTKEARAADDWSHLPAPSERWRESLGLVSRLTIQGPLLAKTLLLLWSVCRSNTALFPNVTERRICDSAQGRAIGRRLDDYEQCDIDPRHGVLLFNSPGCCSGGLSSDPALLHLPSAGFKDITLHSGVPFVSTLPKAWDSCTVYETRPDEVLDALRRDSRSDQPTDLETAAERLRGLDLCGSAREGGLDIGGVPELLYWGEVRYCIPDRLYESNEEDWEEYSEEFGEELRERFQILIKDWRRIAELVQCDDDLELVWDGKERDRAACVTVMSNGPGYQQVIH